MLYVSNAFSLNMLPPGAWRLLVSSLSATEVLQAMEDAFDVINAIGHSSTDAIVRAMLPALPPAERRSIVLAQGDMLVVAQYVGPRLPEGATVLPGGARIEFRMVELA